MKWTVLSDNRRCDDSLETEHGLSILLETKKHRILLDTGASDIFIRNATKMNIDLGMVDYVFISHGHSDHAGGLKHLMKKINNAQVIVSPHAINGKFFSKRGNLHSITAEWPKIDDISTTISGMSWPYMSMACCLQAVPIAVWRTFWRLVLGQFIPLSEVSIYLIAWRQKKNCQLWLKG